jgi:hypothetical protein
MIFILLYMKVNIIFSVSIFFWEMHFQYSWNSHNVIETKYTYRRVNILAGVCNDMLYFYVCVELLSFSRWMNCPWRRLLSPFYFRITFFLNFLSAFCPINGRNVFQSPPGSTEVRDASPKFSLTMVGYYVICVGGREMLFGMKADWLFLNLYVFERHFFVQ